LDELARRLDVSRATLRRWEREGIPAKRKRDVTGVWKRSESARKASGTAAVYGRLVERQGPIAVLRKARTTANDWRETIQERAAKIADSHPGWLAHLSDMNARGFSSHEARNKWMSPKFKAK
jgi:hypothetical protein